MQTHASSCLRGPVTRARPCWPRAGDLPVPRLDDPDIRTDLVMRVRQEIADGTYDTPEKLEAALDRLLRNLDR